MIGNSFHFISFLGNIVNILCVLILTLIFLKDAFRLSINKPNLDRASEVRSKHTKKRQYFLLSFLVGAFIFIIYIFPLINSSFYYFFTKNILSAESGADSPRSGCEAATRCTKIYTVSLLQTIKVYFLIEREKDSQAK